MLGSVVQIPTIRIQAGLRKEQGLQLPEIPGAWGQEGHAFKAPSGGCASPSGAWESVVSAEWFGLVQ